MKIENIAWDGFTSWWSYGLCLTKHACICK